MVLGRPSIDKPQPVAHSTLSVSHTKKKMYDPLMKLAISQTVQGFRSSPPVFTAAVMSTSGEVSTAMYELCCNMVESFKTQAEIRHPNPNGRSVKWLTNDYRSRLRVAIAVACARGTAQVLMTAGKTHGASRVRY